MCWLLKPRVPQALKLPEEEEAVRRGEGGVGGLFSVGRGRIKDSAPRQ